MNLHATQPVDSQGAHPGDAQPPAAPPTTRFSYATGARPLAGYTIKRGIGHGGFGEVYYATSDAGKEVAIKLIRRNLDIELRGVTQCLNLKHPNLLALHDVRTDEQGDNWVVMELVSGCSLEGALASSPEGLPTAEVLAWVHGIAAGVAYLHDHGIVHRDLKPGNIFIDEGIVKIGDYGLSKFISCSRRSGQTGSVGTVHYMAPEVANGRYGKEIDIYALGIILYEMITGRVPFEGESIGEILMKHLTAEPDLSGLDDPYRAIVARCLAKDPDRRLRSVQEMIAMLPPVPPGAVPHFVGPNAHAARGAERTSHSDPAASPRGSAASTGYSLGPLPPQGKPDGDPIDPIARWVREFGADARTWWEQKNLLPWQRVAIVLGGIFIGLQAASRIPPPVWQMLFGALMFYVVYRVAFRYSSGSGSKSPRQVRTSTPVPSAPMPSQPPAAEFKVRGRFHESPTRRRWRERTPQLRYPLPPSRERITQFVGSLLLSAVVCLVVSLIMLILRGESLQPTQYSWLALASTLGAWCVLVPSKLWEGSRGDVALRRFVMLVIGLGYGAAMFGLQNWLLVQLPAESQIFDVDTQVFAGARRALFGPDGTPQILAFLAYFGFLFVIPRWWRIADPLRSTRLSIWHTGVAVFWSAVLAAFWLFPQPWGLMLAGTTAIAVQLASPWLNSDARHPAVAEG